MQAAPGACRPRASAPDPAFLKRYLRDLSQRPRKAGALSLDALDVAAVDGHAEVWEKVVRKLRTGMMPPDGVPKPAPRRARRSSTALEASLDRAAAARLDPGHAGAPSPQPRRIRQRHPRSAGARRGRGGAAAAGRLGRRLRQHRRRARRVAGAHRRAMPPRRRRSAGGPSAVRRSASTARPTGCPATCRRTRTWTACRSARAAASSSATPFRSMPSTTCRWGRPAAPGWADRAAAGPRTDDLYVTIDGVRVTLQGRGATRLQGGRRPAHDCGGQRGAQPRRRRRRRLPRRGAHARHHAGHDRRPVQRHRAGRHAEPPASCSCARRRRPPRSCRARARSCPRWPRARSAGRCAPRARSSRRRCEFYREGRQRSFECGHRARGGAHSRGSAVPLPVRARAGAGGARARPSASATSSWRRGCRSSCGAAFPTTSCWPSAAQGRAERRRPRSSGRCGACWPTRRPRRW